MSLPIKVDTENVYLVIDSNRTIWWHDKRTRVTKRLGIWKGDPEMWGKYESAAPAGVGSGRRDLGIGRG